MYDDDNDKVRTFSGGAVPGGHAAYTRTATVYSAAALTEADLEASSTNASVEAMRKSVRAFTQRVGSVYLVEANILGFAGVRRECLPLIPLSLSHVLPHLLDSKSAPEVHLTP